ncbi:MAG: DEAD/DEAH box helicase, partial [Pseudobdellovibrionaceae bacterium]
MRSFIEFKLLPTLHQTLKESGFHKPTEIQARTIPLILSGQAVVGVAETGSGKTLSYALPLLNKLKQIELEKRHVQVDSTPSAVVIVPTRELGEQVSKVFKTFTHLTRLRVRPALGGMAFEQCRRNVSGTFEILLATPGRLIQLMDQELIHLSQVQFLVFDEADQMMDQGFLPDSKAIAKAIAKACPPDVQMILFSATVSKSVEELAAQLFPETEIIRSSGSGKTVASLKTKNSLVKDGKRWPLFEKIISQPRQGGTLIFTNTREQCDALAAQMK